MTKKRGLVYVVTNFSNAQLNERHLNSPLCICIEAALSFWSKQENVQPHTAL